MNKLSIALIIAAIIVTIGFAISGIVNATAQDRKLNYQISQNNSTNIDKQNIIVTGLETNKTKASSAPMIMVSDQDFWMVFGPLLKQTINGTTSSFD
jgi:pyridoxal/pyridoxine/pyridoxamine kinase